MNSSFEHDSAHHIRLLIDHVPAMLAYWDRELRCRFANRAYERWFGVDPDALVGTSIRDLLGAELFALNEPYIRAALEGKQQVFERVVPGPGGAKRHSLATYIPDIVGGEVVGFIAHVAEVTQLKQTEDALRAEIAQRERAYALLRASESALREAQRLGQVGSWEHEIGSGITVWSEELYRIFGRDPGSPPPEVAERTTMYTNDSWTRLQAAVAGTIATGEPCSLELEYRRTDGRTGWLEACCEAVHAPSGEVTRLRGTVHEITQRRLAEQARLEARAAESANRNKTALLSRVSHELRTPLNGILGFAQLCVTDPTLAPKHRQWAEVIVASGQHMLQLVNEMLDLSAAEAGQISVHDSVVELGPLLDECLLNCSGMAASAGVRLVREPAAAAPVLVRGDRMRLKQIVDNLLSNAVKYGSAGGVVTVTTLDLGDTVELSVDDRGVGLSGEQLKRIFMPFERLGAEKTAVAGTGLGLALSKLLVERMGGRIRVTSRPGAGSSFVVALPSARASPHSGGAAGR